MSKNRHNISGDLSSEPYSFEDQSKSIQKSNQNSKQLDQLFSSQEKFKKFILQIKDSANMPLRQDILTHLENNSLCDKIYKANHCSKSIQNLLNKRIQKMIRNKRIKKNWSEVDIHILTWLVSKVADKNNYQQVSRDITHQDWKFISTLIPGVTAQSCMYKWLSLKKVNLAMYNWSAEQSLLLSQIVTKYNQQSKSKNQIKDWKSISHQLYQSNQNQLKIFRNPKQCRQHWNCYLNPKIKKGPWNEEEDIKLLKKILYNKGAKKWSEMVKDFDGRTQNALKNRYNLIIEKQKKTYKGKNEQELIDSYFESCYVDQFTSLINIIPHVINAKTNNQDSDSKQLQPPQQNYLKKQSQKTQEDLIQSSSSSSSISNPNILINSFKIQKFKPQNFTNISISFLRLIQPGVINSDGSFSQLTMGTFVKKL